MHNQTQKIKIIIKLKIRMNRKINYPQATPNINTKAGMRLDMADTNVADVKPKLSAYKFWLNDPLNQHLKQS